MSLGDNYPAMDYYSCDYQGISGNCGENCPVFLGLDCDIFDEMLECVKDVMSEEEIFELRAAYGLKFLTKTR